VNVFRIALATILERPRRQLSLASQKRGLARETNTDHRGGARGVL